MTFKAPSYLDILLSGKKRFHQASSMKTLLAKNASWHSEHASFYPQIKALVL